MNNPTKPLVMKTAVGTLVYPWLNKPDTKFNEDGLYHVKLELSADDALDIVSELTGLRDEKAAALTKANNKRPKLAGFPCEIKEDGTVVFNIKLNASGINRTTKVPFTQKPVIYGTDGKPTEQLVTNGSKGQVAFEPVVFANAAIGLGLTLRLKAVKVTEFAQMQSNASSFFGDAAPAQSSGSTNGGAEDDYNF